MNHEQTYDVAYAKAMAAADCASSIRMTVILGGGVAEGVKDVKAYRDELRRLADDLTQQAVDADVAAQAYAERYCI